jgi:hypothetical protein
MMDSSEEEILDEVDLSKRTVVLNLQFLLDNLLRHGSEVHLRVINGVPPGATTVAAGILDDALLVVFDRPVPSEILYEDLGKRTKPSELN